MAHPTSQTAAFVPVAAVIKQFLGKEELFSRGAKAVPGFPGCCPAGEERITDLRLPRPSPRHQNVSENKGAPM